jgi:hypothetical protein
LEFESAFRAEMADYFLLGSSDDKFGFDYADALSFPLGASISLGDEAAFKMTPASQIASWYGDAVRDGIRFTVAFLRKRRRRDDNVHPPPRLNIR